MNEEIENQEDGVERDDEDPIPNGYASPPCFMHEVDPAYFGLAASPEATPPSQKQRDDDKQV